MTAIFPDWFDFFGSALCLRVLGSLLDGAPMSNSLDYFRSDWADLAPGELILGCSAGMNFGHAIACHISLKDYCEDFADSTSLAAKLNGASAVINYRLVPRPCHGSTVAGARLASRCLERAER